MSLAGSPSSPPAINRQQPHSPSPIRASAPNAARVAESPSGGSGLGGGGGGGGAAAESYLSACAAERVAPCTELHSALLYGYRDCDASSRQPPLRDADIACIAEALRWPHTLRCLSLEDNDFGVSGLARLLQCLSAPTRLHANARGDAATAAAGGGGPRLRELRLGRNNLGDPAAVVIASALEGPRRNLSGSPDASSPNATPSRSPSPSPSSPISLKILDLSENGITTMGCIAVCHALAGGATAPDLVELSFHNNNIDTEAAPAIVAAITRVGAKLKHLHLGYNQLKDVGATQLARCLPMAPVLATLDLTANRIGPTGGQELARALMTDTCRLQRLNLRSNNLDDETLLMFSEVLLRNTSLTQLYLGYMSPNPKTAATLLTALRHNKNLLMLDMYGWKLDHATCGPLIEDIMQHNTTIRAITTDACQPLFHAIDRNNAERQERGLHDIYIGPDDRHSAIAASAKAIKGAAAAAMAQSQQQFQQAERSRSMATPSRIPSPRRDPNDHLRPAPAVPTSRPQSNVRGASPLSNGNLPPRNQQTTPSREASLNANAAGSTSASTYQQQTQAAVFQQQYRYTSPGATTPSGNNAPLVSSGFRGRSPPSGALSPRLQEQAQPKPMPVPIQQQQQFEPQQQQQQQQQVRFGSANAPRQSPTRNAINSNSNSTFNGATSPQQGPPLGLGIQSPYPLNPRAVSMGVHAAANSGATTFGSSSNTVAQSRFTASSAIVSNTQQQHQQVTTAFGTRTVGAAANIATTASNNNNNMTSSSTAAAPAQQQQQQQQLQEVTRLKSKVMELEQQVRQLQSAAALQQQQMQQQQQSASSSGSFRCPNCGSVSSINSAALINDNSANATANFAATAGATSTTTATATTANARASSVTNSRTDNAFSAQQQQQQQYQASQQTTNLQQRHLSSTTPMNSTNTRPTSPIRGPYNSNVNNGGGSTAAASNVQQQQQQRAASAAAFQRSTTTQQQQQHQQGSSSSSNQFASFGPNSNPFNQPAQRLSSGPNNNNVNNGAAQPTGFGGNAAFQRQTSGAGSAAQQQQTMMSGSNFGGSRASIVTNAAASQQQLMMSPSSASNAAFTPMGMSNGAGFQQQQRSASAANQQRGANATATMNNSRFAAATSATRGPAANNTNVSSGFGGGGFSNSNANASAYGRANSRASAYQQQSQSYAHGAAEDETCYSYPDEAYGPSTQRPATDFRNPYVDADQYYGNPTGRAPSQSPPRVTEQSQLDYPLPGIRDVKVDKCYQPNIPVDLRDERPRRAGIPMGYQPNPVEPIDPRLGQPAAQPNNLPGRKFPSHGTLR